MVISTIQYLAAPVTAFPAALRAALRTARIPAGYLTAPSFGTPMLIGNRDVRALRAQEQERQSQHGNFGYLGHSLHPNA